MSLEEFGIKAVNAFLEAEPDSPEAVAFRESMAELRKALDELNP